MSNSVNIPFAKVDCSGNELNYVAEVLQSGWLTTGRAAAAFEDKFKQLTGARYAHAVSSCTAALHLALDAAGVKAGDKVLVPTMTFAATVEVICYLNAIPILMDVDPGTSCVNESIVANALDQHPDVKAVMVVHYGGQAAPIGDGEGQGILSLCRSKGITLIEDAAHAFPAKEAGKMIGGFGDITCFSFYANKTITTGEGGMLTCQNKTMSERISRMRLHGIDRDVWTRYRDHEKFANWEYDVVAAGYKYNMADLNAAVGLAQIERAESMRSKRQEIAQRYRAALAGNVHVNALTARVPDDCHAWHLFPILVAGGIRVRNQTIELLSSVGIGTSVHYKPIHRLSYYRDLLQVTPEQFPNAEMLWESTISLPIYHSMTKDEVSYVIDHTMKFVDPHGKTPAVVPAVVKG